MLPDWLSPEQPPPPPDDPVLQRLLDEIARRESGQMHLADYAQQVVGVIPAAHHRMICDVLEQGILNDEWDDCVICTPPGSAKSTYVSHVLPAWFIGHFPEKNVILASHTASLAEKWSRRVRDTVSSPEHSRIFENSGLSKDSTAVTRWSTSRNGEFLAAGAGMSILGFRSDICILDDVVSGWEQAQSVTQLQKLHDWFKSDLKSRLKPHAKIITVCQRTAAYDMAGYIMKEFADNPTRRLRTVILPMVCDDPANDPMGRALNERLWPEWYTDAMVTDLMKDEFTWRTMWMQHPPSDSGSWVTTEEIQYRPTPPVTRDSSIYGMTDLALSVNTGDYTTHFMVAVDAEGDWDIIHGERDRCDPDTSANKVVSLCASYQPREWLIDDDNMAKVFMPLLATRARQTGTNVPVKMMPMRGQDKETRAAPLRGQFKRRKVFMDPAAPFAHWLVRELLTFPNAVGEGVDDGVDALGLMGRRLMAISKAANVVPIRRNPTIADMTLDALFSDMPNRSTQRI